VGRIVFPTFSRLQNDKQAIRSALEKSLSLLFLTAGAFTLAFCTLAPALISNIFGTKWEPATTAFILFSFTMLGGYITTPFLPLLSALGYVRAALLAALAWLGLAWVLGLAFSWIWGYNGIAVASAVATLLIAAMLGFLIYLQVKFSFWRSCRSAVFAFSPVGLGFWLIQAQLTNFWLLALAGVIGGLIYLGLVFLQERHELKATLQTLLKSA
jgi:PST family polysaccharide transporter